MRGRQMVVNDNKNDEVFVKHKPLTYKQNSAHCTICFFATHAEKHQMESAQYQSLQAVQATKRQTA